MRAPPVTALLTDEPIASRVVVAVAVKWRGRVGLFRRSNAVAHDRGRWHCITGYLEPDSPPHYQALLELYEETGLRVADLESFDVGKILTLTDNGGLVWTVHTYRAVTTRRRLKLNEEHDSYRWVLPAALARFGNQVDWLLPALAASGAILADEASCSRWGPTESVQAPARTSMTGSLPA